METENGITLCRHVDHLQFCYSDSSHSAQQSDVSDDWTMPDAFTNQPDPLEWSEPAPDSVETPHVPCFCAFYIFNTTPNPTSSSMFLYLFTVFLLKQECMCVHVCSNACVCLCVYVSSSKFKLI